MCGHDDSSVTLGCRKTKFSRCLPILKTRQLTLKIRTHSKACPGSGGTIVGVLAGSGALDDVLSAIADMVAFQARGEFDFRSWRARWEKAQETPANP